MCALSNIFLGNNIFSFYKHPTLSQSISCFNSSTCLAIAGPFKLHILLVLLYPLHLSELRLSDVYLPTTFTFYLLHHPFLFLFVSILIFLSQSFFHFLLHIIPLSFWVYLPIVMRPYHLPSSFLSYFSCFPLNSPSFLSLFLSSFFFLFPFFLTTPTYLPSTSSSLPLQSLTFHLSLQILLYISLCTPIHITSPIAHYPASSFF